MRRFAKWLSAALTLPVLAIGMWLIGFMPVFTPFCSGTDLPLGKLTLPEGFHITVYARTPGARSMCWGEKGTLFVGTRDDKVYAVTKGNQGRAMEVIVIASGLREPNGVAFKDGDLYVADVDRVLKYPDIEDRLHQPPTGTLVSEDLPSDGHHGWRYASFGPDGLLYIAVGAPCNVCERPDPFATIIRMDDKGEYEVFARGIRNSVGFDWQPSTNVLWFTNNGRDWMGDDQPPDSVHRADRPGLNFGFPYCHAGVPDPKLNHGKGCDQYSPPVLRLPAHVAALGLRFYQGKMFPQTYRDRIFIAEHGSWNRSIPIGYRITMARVDGDRAVDYQTFVSGWLDGATAWGRPVDVIEDSEGALLVSDDRAGTIYRISYRHP